LHKQNCNPFSIGGAIQKVLSPHGVHSETLVGLLKNSSSDGMAWHHIYHMTKCACMWVMKKYNPQWGTELTDPPCSIMKEKHYNHYTIQLNYHCSL
jgi:hypothetical protein